MKKIIMYTSLSCSFCSRAEMLIKKYYKYEIQKIMIDQNEEAKKLMIEITGGKKTVPQIFIDHQYIGGYEDLAFLEHSNSLKNLLQDN